MQVEKLKECLVKLALRSGFDSLDEFARYKEKNNCATNYVAVYPEIQIISRNDDKTYIDNLK
jgi:hypothetical protein